jgi:hypothetical protein
VVVIVLEEEVLVAAVAGEEHGSGSEAGQAVLEAVPAGKGALLSPSLTMSQELAAIHSRIKMSPLIMPGFGGSGRLGRGYDVRSLPGVVSRRAGGLLKGTHVEAGNVGLGSAVGGSQ